MIKCNCGKHLNIDNETNYIAISIYDINANGAQTCFLVKEEFNIDEVKKEILNYLKTNDTNVLKFKDRQYNGNVLFKRISKNKIKVEVGYYSVTLDSKDALNEFTREI